MERVKKGEKYWCVGPDLNPEEVTEGEDWAMDILRIGAGNCFSDYHDAYMTCVKFRAVLKGAEVIEMPKTPLGLADIKNNHLRGYVPERLSLDDLKAFAFGFWEGCNWIASKIVK